MKSGKLMIKSGELVKKQSWIKLNGRHRVELTMVANIRVQSSWCLQGHTSHTVSGQTICHSKSTAFYQDHLIRRVDARVWTLKACFGLVVCPWFGLVMCPRPLLWSWLRYHFVILSATSGNSCMAYPHLFVTFLIPPDTTLSFYQVWPLVATAVWLLSSFLPHFPGAIAIDAIA